MCGGGGGGIHRSIVSLSVALMTNRIHRQRERERERESSSVCVCDDDDIKSHNTV